MKLAGLIKTSLIDYPGKVAAVVFTQGCNFRCGFCHNPDLIPSAGSQEISDLEFFQYLSLREGLLDGVVITGGEPTVQADLPAFISKIREYGYKVKLDTNGSNPKILKDLLNGGMLNYVAMDIKGPLENYTKISHFSETENIKKSIKMIMESGLEYEFRTTVLPYFHKISDFSEVGRMIKGAKRFSVQGFRPETVFDKTLKNEKSFTGTELEEIAGILKKYVKEVVVRDNL